MAYLPDTTDKRQRATTNAPDILIDRKQNRKFSQPMIGNGFLNTFLLFLSDSTKKNPLKLE